MGEVQIELASGHLKRKYYLEDLCIECRSVEWSGVDLIHLAQERGHWQAVMNKILFLRIHKGRKFLH